MSPEKTLSIRSLEFIGRAHHGRLLTIALGFVFTIVLPQAAAMLGEPTRVVFAQQANTIALVESGRATPLIVSQQDWPGVLRAARDLQADFKRVSNVSPEVASTLPSHTEQAVIVGTVGRSEWIDQLVRAGRLDVASLQGKWEAWTSQVIDHPLPGIERALVIAGSDKRGTIYGVYQVSEQIGVSPWYWWADVTPSHKNAIYWLPEPVVQDSPAVRYRGIFINDEAPDLTNWIRAKFGNASPSKNPPVGTDVANYGHEFYARIFEVLLRLRANYLWPAMWSNAFNEDDPENARLADEYGIVMGTSHQEPMLRSQQEWDRRFKSTLGHWNYAKHSEVLESFWREGVRRNKNFESVITMGLRGADDTEMAAGGPEANRALLEHIVAVQRKILSDEVSSDLTKVPQVWCLYKEVQEYYEHGMRVPEDVTLLWAEDNWGNLRRVPAAAERNRSGGSGIYYHFDYHGAPRSYQWINTNPLPKIWDQMSLAYEYGADRIWVVNVGHFKGYEVPLEFFMNLAWNPRRWGADNVNEFLRCWAQREFGSPETDAIADIVAGYAKWNARRKPELLSAKTYSITNYKEAEHIITDFSALTLHAKAIYEKMPAEKRDAYFQLVLFPTMASAVLNEVYFEAARNELFGEQKRASTRAHAENAAAAFSRFTGLIAFYNRDFAGGRWAHFMDQAVLGYTSWNDPPENSLKHLAFVDVQPSDAASLGVAIEGSRAAWPGANNDAVLPEFDVFNRQVHYFEIFNRGKTPFAFTATANEPWVILNTTSGSVGPDARIEVRVDWSRLPRGRNTAAIEIRGAGKTVTVRLSAFAPEAPSPEAVQGFVESDGVISIEAAHFARKRAEGESRWTEISDYGHTLSGMRAEGVPDVLTTPGKDAPVMEYEMFLFHEGRVTVKATTGPTLNFLASRPIRYAIAFDDQPPVVVTVAPETLSSHYTDRQWSAAVSDNGFHPQSQHTVAKAGQHTLKVWMIDPGLVLEKLVVDTGGLRPSYLGPPESYRRK